MNSFNARANDVRGGKKPNAKSHCEYLRNPHPNDLTEQSKDKPVVFISVTSENEDVVRLFLKNHPVKTSVGLDDYEVLNKTFLVRLLDTVQLERTGRKT
jgi:hypothetical protein